MLRRVLFGVLLLGSLSLLTTAQDSDDGTPSISVDVGVGGDEGGGGVSVSVEVGGDLCEGHDCPEGEACQVVESGLLQMPVAHCTLDPGSPDHSDSQCEEYTVGSNVMNCHTEGQWRGVGETQCALRGSRNTTLVEVQVQHACHNRHSSARVRFLSATFICCPKQLSTGSTANTPPTKPLSSSPHTPPSTSSHTPITFQEEPTLPQEGDSPDDVGGVQSRSVLHASYVVPVVLGAVLFTVAMFALLVCVRRHNHTLPGPKLPSLTFYINPNMEEEEGEGDRWKGVEEEEEEEEGWREKDTARILNTTKSSCGK